MNEKRRDSTGTPTNWKKRAAALLVVLGTLGAAQWVGGHIQFSESASVHDRIFWLEPIGKDVVLRKWDYVVFPKAHPFLFDGKEKPYVKVVRCLPGQWLKTEPDRTFWCDGEFLGMAATKDSKGRPTPLFSYNGRIPEGRYFVLGEHPMSFDSKYWGFVRRDEITARAKPLF